MSPIPTPALDCPDLSFPALRSAYSSGMLTPVALVRRLHDFIERSPHQAAWIHRLPLAALLARAEALMTLDPATLPLYGLPFAVKDNIDVAGLPTTAACPDFAYVAEHTAAAVQRLLDAGAILVGKTNLDQFATGLVGTRSPYGIPSSVFSAAHVSGGSSSGSAVAVAAGCVSFALGTDTAGSGRVPAAFNNIVGAKPTRGWLSTRGVVPACRSLDCVSVFALSAGEAWEVLRVAGGEDGLDPWSRAPAPRGLPPRPRIGVPRADQLEFFGDAQAAACFAAALARLRTLGDVVEIDFAPFAATARLLYEGPWVAERLEAAGPLIEACTPSVDATVRAVIERGKQYSAADMQSAQTQLAILQKQAATCWQHVDLLVVPTAPTHYRIDEVQADPIRLNSRLGIYTNFTNLLDLCGVAVPGDFRTDGLPSGITLLAPAWQDAALAELAGRFQRQLEHAPGLTGHPLAPAPARCEWPAHAKGIKLAVVGAHLSGMPLNRELTERAARFVCATHTSPEYRLYALPDTTPPKPGLARVASGGAAIAVEVWELAAAAFGDFVARVPAPLGIGTLTLADGGSVKGFICEPCALAGATDITAFGGWRAYLASRAT